MVHNGKGTSEKWRYTNVKFDGTEISSTKGKHELTHVKNTMVEVVRMIEYDMC